jgi:hypothetical protein
MKLCDNYAIHAEALRRLGYRKGVDPASLTIVKFDRFLEMADSIKLCAGPHQNVVICVDCSAVHDCPHDAQFETAFTYRKVCGSCGSRSGFRDVVGRWVPFSTWWKPLSWGRGCWAFEFCT